MGNSQKPIALITGADSGLGFETAKELSIKGYHAIMACMDESKAMEAINKILTINPKASLEFCEVDLRSFEMVEELASYVIDNYPRLHILVNNAGINDNPLEVTADGFEATFQVNYLSHVLLTNRLLPLVEAAQGRIVHVTSYGHNQAVYDINSPLWQPIDNTQKLHYDGIQTYFNSKLANLLFHYELSRYLSTNGSMTMSIAVHPGSAKTNMLKINSHANLKHTIFQIGETIVGQTAKGGARPTLHACLDNDVINGNFYGPDGLSELRGNPVKVQGSKTSQNPEYQREMWEHTCELLNLDLNFGFELAPTVDISLEDGPDTKCILQ